MNVGQNHLPMTTNSFYLKETLPVTRAATHDYFLLFFLLFIHLYALTFVVDKSVEYFPETQI